MEQAFAQNLKLAIDQDDPAAVKQLLSDHPELRAAPIGYGGDGPLTWAAECRGMVQPSPARLAIVEWLITSGSDIHEGGDAPLMRASLSSTRTPMMALLVSMGADVNAAWHGSFPIIFAPCETLDPAAIAWLLQHGADPNCGLTSALRSTDSSHPGTALDYLLGTYLRNREALNASIRLLQDAGGFSRYDEPGVIAAIRGNVDAIRKFLQEDRALIERKYPSLNIGTTAGRMLTLKGANLLHVAAEFGQVAVAKLLLDAGADVDARAFIDADGQGGQTPIFHAASQNNDFSLEVVQLLISAGADLHVRCRLPGHYERPEEIFEGTVLEYARLFPGSENRTCEELLHAQQEQ